MKLWLSKPAYELVPFFYLVAGVAALAASPYPDAWYWSALCVLAGVGLVSVGLMVWLKRRDFRREQRG